MHDWNVVVTVNEDGYRSARRLLERYGTVAPTDFFNVMVMRVGNPEEMMNDLARQVAEFPGIMNDLSRVVPARATFDFEDAEDFEKKAWAIVQKWTGELGGASFHVRLHRRGFKGQLSSPKEERFLDEAILERLEKEGAPGRISFDDPDAVIDIETVGRRAGVSLWTGEEIQRYPFLHID